MVRLYVTLNTLGVALGTPPCVETECVSVHQTVCLCVLCAVQILYNVSCALVAHEMWAGLISSVEGHGVVHVKGVGERVEASTTRRCELVVTFVS